MIETIRAELEAKIKELEWKNNLRSLEMIEWINWLLKRMETKEEVKEVEVELPKEEVVEKPTPKKKISFKKK